MKHSLKVGFSFGLTSGIITTLGLMIGLYSGTNSQIAVIGGILTIALADSMSDALGIHVSEESENKHSSKEIWESTVCTFLFKFIVASSFLIPVIIFELRFAIVICIIYGLTILGIFSFIMAKNQNNKVWRVVSEHLLIAVIVIILANYIGYLINVFFTS